VILDEARDLTRSYLELYEGDNKTNVPSGVLDQAINVAMQEHFGETQDLYSYGHTLYVENMEEYTLPSDCIAVIMLKVAGVRYTQQNYPYIKDVINGR